MSNQNVIVIVAGLVCVMFVLIVWLPRRLSASFQPDGDRPNDRIRLENELRITFIQMFGGLFVLGGLYFGWQNLATLQKGQLTDRFTKAVEQMGSQDFSIRLGGVFSLERIANESEREDRQAVMEILTAYVRAHSKQASRRDDIQAILQVIGRRVPVNEGVHPLRLTNVNLENLDLSGGNFSHISFVGSQFSGATLADTRFDAADLSYCDFHNADLRRTVLDNAKALAGKFQYARLFGARLQGADLSGADLSGANFWGSDLTNTDFTGADLHGAFLAPEQRALTHGRPKRPPSRPSDVLRVLRMTEGQLMAVLHPKVLQPREDQLAILLVLEGGKGFASKKVVRPNEFLTIFCEGLGALRWPMPLERCPECPRTETKPKVTFDTEEADVDYWGISTPRPTYYQINLQVPERLRPGKHRLQVSVNGRSSQAIEIISGPE